MAGKGIRVEGYSVENCSAYLSHQREIKGILASMESCRRQKSAGGSRESGQVLAWHRSLKVNGAPFRTEIVWL